jgi:hypothetical protein
MKAAFSNLIIKGQIRDLIVPVISVSVRWLTFNITAQARIRSHSEEMPHLNARIRIMLVHIAHHAKSVAFL